MLLLHAYRYLLPPVIFYCGLSVEKSRFFLALPSILMYGVFGTLASFIIISVFMYLTLGFAMFKMEVRVSGGAMCLPGVVGCFRRCWGLVPAVHHRLPCLPMVARMCWAISGL